MCFLSVQKMTRLHIKHTIMTMMLSSILFSGCSDDCDIVEPCFSFAPPFATFNVINQNNEVVQNVTLQVSGANVQGTCDKPKGLCTIQYSRAGTIQVEISSEGYQIFSSDYEVIKEPDMSNDGCTVEGCLMNNIPRTVVLIPNS